MNRKILSFFEVAARTATSKVDKRSFLLGAIGIRNDGVMVRSLNSPTENKNRKVHAECKLCRKLDYGAEAVYVARVRLDNFEFGMARPCNDCRKILKSKRVKKVFYTISQTSYGIIDFAKNTEVIYGDKCLS
jgi:tRNA(Arg) A34 adenosine deaminase TadA